MAQKLTVVVVLMVMCGIGGFALAAESEDPGSGPPASHRSNHALLSSLDEAQRANAVIEFELPGGCDLATRLQADQVSSLWNEGRTAEALVALDRLEATGASLVVGIAWKVAVPADAPEIYNDVPIGNGRTGYEDAALGSSGASGNIFVLVQWTDGWSMNISTNRGVSFSETFYWGSHAPADLDVVGGHAWVGYGYTGEARMRRFHIADGSEDTVYGYETITSVSPNTISEVAVVSDAPDNNNRIYMFYIVPETGVIDYWWDDLNGASFSLISTGISNAANGLDATWNPYSKLGEGYLWIMYLSTINQVHLYVRRGAGWDLEASQDFTGLQRHTGVSAFADNVYGVYSKNNGTGQYGVVYMTTPDAGGSWMVDDAYWPAAGGRSAHGPNISVRSGLGRAVVYTSDEASTDWAWHSQRRGWAPGAWEPPFIFSNQDAGWGARTEIEWIRALCVGSYGLVYRNDSMVPYFDLITYRCFFSDGFESGNTGQWDLTNP